MKRNLNLFLKVFIVLAAFLINMNLDAQQFGLYGFDTTAFPTMKVGFYARMQTGRDYNNIVVGDFDLWENGVLMNPTLAIDCQTIKSYPPIAAQLILDNSSSMNNPESDGLKRIDWVKAGAQAFLDSIHLDPPSMAAMNSFAGNVVANSGLQTTKQPLLDWLNTHMTLAGTTTNFGNAFLQTTVGKEGGLVELMKAPPNLRRVAILLTDGDPDPISMWTQKIIDSIKTIAKREKIQIYSIFIRVPMVNGDINDICQYTGGQSFIANSKQEVMDAFRKIVGDVQSQSICQLTWTAPYGCDEASRTRSIKAVFKRIPDSAMTSYLAPTTSISNVTMSANQLLFGKPGVGTTTQDVIITSSISDYTITGAKFIPEAGKYTINWNGNTPPFKILKGKNATIKINYIEPNATSSVETMLAIEADVSNCTPPLISLIAPCGGVYEQLVDFKDVPILSIKDSTYTCIYKNTAATQISGIIKLTGANASDFELIPNISNFSLKPDSCLSLTVRFKPTSSSGNKTANIEYNIPTACGTLITNLTGNAVQVAFPMPTLDFKEKRILTVNQLNYPLKNSNANTVKITSIKLKNNDLNYSAVFPTVPINLTKDSLINIPVTFTPQTDGVAPIVNYIDVEIENLSGTQSGTLTGIGTLPKFASADVAFPPTKTLVSSAPKSIIITNPSLTADLTISKVIMQGGQTDFKFDNGVLTDNLTVPKNNGSLSLPVIFTPQATGNRTAKVVIKHDAAPGPLMNPIIEDTILLSGLGLGLNLTGTYDFGDVYSCVTKENTYVIDNTTGSGDIVNITISFSGAGAGAFSVTSPLVTVPKGQKGNFKIGFAPTANTVYNATLSIKTSVGDVDVPLTGRGIFAVIKPTIIENPAKLVMPDSIFTLNLELQIPDLQGLPINTITLRVDYYSKSLRFRNQTNDISSNLTGWTWTYNQLNNSSMEFTGTGIPITTAKTVTVLINDSTFLADVSSSNVIVSTTFNNGSISCIIPEPDTTILKVTTCFTEGRLILPSATKYFLTEAQPNPVNTSFKMKAGIGLDALTTLEIYNSIGNKVSSIVNKELKSGEYEFVVPVNNLSSGVYMIRLESGPFIDVKKLVISK